MIALPSPTKTLPLPIWRAIGTECQRIINELRGLCERCDALGHGDKRAGYARIADGAGIDHKTGKPKISGEALRKIHQGWRKRGELALIDHRHCGGKCQQPECRNKGRQCALPEALIEEWARRFLSNRAVDKRTWGTRTMREGWRSLIASLIAGDKLPGVGTWRDIYREQTGKTAPERCPYSQGRPPHGWSYQNFLLHKPSKALVALIQRGLSTAVLAMPEVRLDLSTLRTLEMVAIDDKRVDVAAHGLYEGKYQVCEVWLLVIMDLATRMVLWASLYPRFRREDGTTTGIRRRDVQSSFAYMLSAFGVPRYGMTILCENASAAITADVELIMTRISGGLITIRRTGMLHGSVLAAGAQEKSGNPRAKSWLESSFGHGLDIVLGSIKGQIGSRYELKPGDTQGRLMEAARIIRAVGDVATPEQMEKLMPVESLAKVRPLIMRGFADIAERHDHRLQGFEEIALWRWNPADSQWRPMNDQALAALPLEAANAVLAQPGCVTRRMESRRERWNRLHQPDLIQTLAPAALVDLMMDSGSVEYGGTGVFRVKAGKSALEFYGLEHGAQAREVVTLRYNEDMLEVGAFVFDPAGHYLGRVDYRPRTAPEDRDGLERQLGQRKKALSELVKQARNLMQPAEALEGDILEVSERESLLRVLKAESRGRVLDISPESQALAAAVEGLRSPGRRPAESLSDEEWIAALEAEAANG